MLILRVEVFHHLKITNKQIYSEFDIHCSTFDKVSQVPGDN